MHCSLGVVHIELVEFLLGLGFLQGLYPSKFECQVVILVDGGQIDGRDAGVAYPFGR